MGKNTYIVKDFRQLPRTMYVARVVEQRQPPFNTFLSQVRRCLGHAATIKTIDSTHVTLLDSSPARHGFNRLGYTPSDVRQFSNELQQYLDNELQPGDRDVSIDPEQTFVWMGRQCCKLALRLVQDEVLDQERQLIKEFLAAHFSRPPKLLPFEPHITIGQVNHNLISKAAQRNPDALLPSDILIPEQVTLNGLVVYLDYIDSRPSHK